MSDGNSGTGLVDGIDASSRALIGRLYREQLRPQSGRFAVTIVCMVIVAASSAGMVYLLQPVLDDILIKRDHHLLYAIPAAVVALALLTGGAGYIEAVFMEVIGHRMVSNLQAAMYERLIHADLALFHGTSTGKLISRFTNDASVLRYSIAKALIGLIKSTLMVAAYVAVMFNMDWLLAVIALFVFPLAIYPIARIGRRMRKVSANTQVEMGEFTTLLDETFQGARHVKAYTMEERETARAVDLIERIFRLYRKAARTQAISRPLMETLGGITLAAVILYGGLRVLNGGITPGALVAFIGALLAAYRPMKIIASLNATLQQGLAAAQRVFSVLDLQPGITDCPGAKALRAFRGDIRFEDVHFGYALGAKALDGIDLDIPHGATVALVGPSGAGKSTVLNLIPRFYDVDSGRVTVDGEDVRDLTLASLRGAVALVSQEISLFDDTVRANIAYGRPGATDAEIVAAARDAGAHEFIVDLPDGYDTHVGGRGVKLSGGQRQRIAIARAMIKDAPILLLDEATSALDTETERQVQAAIARLKQGRTTIVIAHRLSTVIDADAIFVMEAGRVIEIGTHGELLARGGAYSRLYAMQFAGQEAGDGAEDGVRARAQA